MPSTPTTTESFRPVEIGTILPSLEVIDLTVDGGAIARHNGEVVFLDSGIPDSIVSAKVVLTRKNALYATVLDCLEPSPHERIPWCPVFGECGGCAWQHIDMPVQHTLKEKRVADTLRRIGGVTAAVEPIKGGVPQGFRTKMTYAFGLFEEKHIIGLRQKKSQQVVPVAACGLQPRATPVLQAVQDFLDANPGLSVWADKKGYLRFLTVHTPVFCGDFPTEQCTVEFIVNKAPNTVHKILYAFVNDLVGQGIATGAIVGQRRSASTLAFSEKRLYVAGTIELTEQYGDVLPFAFSPRAFMQTNTEVFSALLERAYELIPWPACGSIWDLYCGCGVIGQYLVSRNGSGQTTRLFGVDSEAKAVEYAAKNAVSHGIANAVYTSSSLDTALSQAPFNPDLIILDPPRNGVEKNILDQISASAARYILYISCDIGTQARDIKRLGQSWRVERTFPFDMFPGTPHVENMLLLTRN